MLFVCAQAHTGSSFCTLVTPLVARSVWNTVSRPPSTASLRASQITSVAVVSTTCEQQSVQHRMEQESAMLGFTDRWPRLLPMQLQRQRLQHCRAPL
jgi:hypothetical protein